MAFIFCFIPPIQNRISQKSQENNKRLDNFFKHTPLLLGLSEKEIKFVRDEKELINEFKRITFNDPGLEKVKEVAFAGHQSDSKKRYEKKKLLKKEFAKIRRRNKRSSGRTK